MRPDGYVLLVDFLAVHKLKSMRVDLEAVKV
jgi:hypothetical protein